MKILIPLLLITLITWSYLLKEQPLSEELVNDYYQQQEIALFKRSPEALCALLSNNFQADNVAVRIFTNYQTEHGNVNIEQPQQIVTGKKQFICQQYQTYLQLIASTGESMGGLLELNHDYNVNAITLSADKHTVVVDYDFSLSMLHTIIKVHSIDTLVRKGGKTLMIRSTGWSKELTPQ